MSVRPSRKNHAKRSPRSWLFQLTPIETQVLAFIVENSHVTDSSTDMGGYVLNDVEDIARAIGSNESDVIGALLSLEKRGAIELPESFRKSIHRVEVPVLTPKGEQVLRNYANGDTSELKAIARQVGISEEEAAQMLGMLSTFERP